AICAHTFWITTQVLFDEVEHCGAVPRVGSDVRQGRRNDDLMLVVYGGLCVVSLNKRAIALNDTTVWIREVALGLGVRGSIGICANPMKREPIGVLEGL